MIHLGAKATFESYKALKPTNLDGSIALMGTLGGIAGFFLRHNLSRTFLRAQAAKPGSSLLFPVLSDVKSIPATAMFVEQFPNRADLLRGITCDYRPAFDIPANNRAGPDDDVISDCRTGH